jgi:hypothetical protein
MFWLDPLPSAWVRLAAMKKRAVSVPAATATRISTATVMRISAEKYGTF